MLSRLPKYSYISQFVRFYTIVKSCYKYSQAFLMISVKTSLNLTLSSLVSISIDRPCFLSAASWKALVYLFSLLSEQKMAMLWFGLFLYGFSGSWRKGARITLGTARQISILKKFVTLGSSVWVLANNVTCVEHCKKPDSSGCSNLCSVFASVWYQPTNK